MNIYSRLRQAFAPETGGQNGAAKATDAALPPLVGLVVGCVGVVYGDIGTSPLYAFREATKAAVAAGLPLDQSVLGVLSLILWSLIIVVTGKYVLLLLQADNRGKGGTFALMALAQAAFSQYAVPLGWVGMVGVSFFFGDAVITPAISVLSAVEGLTLAAPGLHGMVLPLSLIILTLLFAAQPFGTKEVAKYFGPVMLFWFAALALGGLHQLLANPSVLRAVAPWHAIGFLAGNGVHGFLIMGLVFLAVTGAEALYADLGHFGRTPIRLAWFSLVFPALLLNYFGQGALILQQPDTLDHPFYGLYPRWAVPTMVVLAMLATIIASQAVITGAFSLVRQAVQLNLLPRLAIFHTSAQTRGQIYVPRVNWLLFGAVLFVTMFFRSSANLAAAYGISVAADMVFGSVLAIFALASLWRWRLQRVALLMAPFLALELTFVAANSSKLLEGAWLPLLMAAAGVVSMHTWTVGARLMYDAARRSSVSLEWFADQLAKETKVIVPGTAVFFTPVLDMVPLALLHNIKHNRVLHERNYIFTFVTDDRPFVPPLERVEVSRLTEHITRITAHYGFMQSPHVPRLLPLVRNKGIEIDINSASFFVSQRSVYTTRETQMAGWQKLLFVWLHKHAQNVGAYYRIPRDRLIEIGTQLAI
jgi:KUP system potassium uptake protein